MYSDGLLITDAFLDALEKRGLHPGFRFRFDGEGYQNKMRGVPGAERIVPDAMRRCRERGIRSGVTVMVCRKNRSPPGA